MKYAWFSHGTEAPFLQQVTVYITIMNVHGIHRFEDIDFMNVVELFTQETSSLESQDNTT